MLRLGRIFADPPSKHWTNQDLYWSLIPDFEALRNCALGLAHAHSVIETISSSPSLLKRRDCTMAAKVLLSRDGIYDILIMDADGQHLELENFEDLDAARRRLPAIASLYPGTKVTLWNRNTRAILAETDGY
jgi:hypothetical protein